MSIVRYLLDTNIVSEPLRPSPNPAMLDRLRQHQAEIAIPSVVWHELWYGCSRLPHSHKRTKIENYLNHVVALSIPILAYDASAAFWHAAERARLDAIGQPRPFADGQIAAIAKVHGLVLVTLNVVDFRNFQGLQIESWES